MATSTIIYQGQLRTQATHLYSNTEIITDAPLDNNGRAEAFSPTDLVATALGSCMITLMGISANNYGWNIDGTHAEITKIMASDPRRIIEIQIKMNIADRGLDDKAKIILEKAAITCPVAKSLHPDINQNIEFLYFLPA